MRVRLHYAKFFVVIFSVINVVVLFGITIGPDDTTVGYFSTSQTVEDGDRIGHFALLAAGFSLSASTVTGTFDAVFPVAGTISLNNGTLALSKDLILHNVASINSLGDVQGNNYVFELSSKMKCFPSGEVTSCSSTFVNSVATADNVRSVDWSSDSQYVVAGLNNNAGNELVVYSWNGATLTFEDGVSLANDAWSVAWHPSNDWIAVGRDGGTGDEIYTYTFSRAAGTLTLLDSVNLGGFGNDANSVSWHPDGDQLAVGSDSNTQELIVYEIDSAGTFGASVTMNLSRDANTVDWNAEGTYLAVGTDAGGGWDELRVYSFVKSPLGLTLNASFNVAARMLSVAWNKTSPNTDVIAVGLDTSTDRFRLYRHDGGGGTLTLIPTTDDTISIDVNSVHWRPDSSCLTIALDINSQGPGGEIRTFAFASDDLTFVQNFEIGSSVFAVRWSSDGQYFATGDLANNIQVYALDVIDENAPVVFSNLQLILNSNLTFKKSIAFSGQSVIDGEGYVLTLASTATLLVAPNSTLLMRDITIEGVNDNRIRGMDSTSTFSFQDTSFILDGDYTFSTGQFEILKDFTIIGDGNSFIYTSDQQSTIRGGIQTGSDPCDTVGFCGRMILDHGVTFSYNSASADRISFEGSTSQMVMNSATFAALTNVELITGRLMIDGKSYFAGSNSITIGDGTAANNLCIEWLPAGNLIVTGDLINKNV